LGSRSVKKSDIGQRKEKGFGVAGKPSNKGSKRLNSRGGVESVAKKKKAKPGALAH